MTTDEKIRFVRLLGLPVVLVRAALDIHAILTATEPGPGTVLATTAALSLLHLALLVTAVALTWSAATSRVRIGLGLLAAIGALTIPGVVGLLHMLGHADLWMWLTLVTFVSVVALGVVALLALRDQTEVTLFQAVPDVRGWIVIAGGMVATWASLVVRLPPLEQFPPLGTLAYRIELAPTTAEGQVNLLVIVTALLVIAAAATSRPWAVAVAIATPLAVGFVGQIVADLLLLMSSQEQVAALGFASRLEPGTGFVALLGATGTLILALSLPRRPEVNAAS
ncbi:MAG: hypothetical protein KY469_18925 [Actinobacteria bacterium]|nr:hypothetical protein [Actinomycetota bacterium]